MVEVDNRVMYGRLVLVAPNRREVILDLPWDHEINTESNDGVTHRTTVANIDTTQSIWLWGTQYRIANMLSRLQ